MKLSVNVVKRSFIGLEAKIVNYRAPNRQSVVGRILDETRNTFVLKHNDEKRTIIKEGTLFQFTFPDGSIVEIDGKTIVGRPENRIKQRFRWRW